MRHITSTFILLVAATLLSSCTSVTDAMKSEKLAIDQVSAPFAESGITLEIQTDTDLNTLNGMANSCTLLVIQAQKASTLNKLLSNPFALKELFSAAGAQDELLKVDRYPAMPGQSTTLHIDRSENSRFVAIVAGYYPFPQQQHMALVAIPVTTRSSGWWHPDWLAQLSPLALKIRLGSSGITQLDGAKPEPLDLTHSDAATSPTDKKGG